MNDYCPNCGNEVIDVAYATSVVERAPRCKRCELEMPNPNGRVLADKSEGVYHDAASCEHVDHTASSTTIQISHSADGVPCFECYGVENDQEVAE